MQIRFKRQIIPLAAVFLLFFTQFLYFYLEADFGVDDLRFAAAELIFFYVFFTFSLLELYIPEAIWAFLGCAALSVLRCRMIIPSFTNATVFLVHLPVCIFLLALDRAAKKPEQGYGILLTGVYPTLFLGFLIYYMIRFPLAAKHLIDAGLNYGCFAFPALIILYAVIRRGRTLKKVKTDRQANGFLKDCFLFAVLSMALTFLLLRLWETPALNFTASLFWLTVLLILYRKGNPLLCSFFERLHIKQNP